MTADEMTQFLQGRIPLAAAMRAEVVSLEPARAVLRGQLAPNVNPYGVVFGGSLGTFGLLAGWVVVYRALAQAGVAAYPVVRKSECEFLMPVAGDFFAEASVDAAALREFTVRAVEGRARIRIVSTIRADGRECAVHTALFAAVAKTS